MQPLGHTANGPQRGEAQLPGSDAFAALEEADVQPDALFFHRFYRCQRVCWVIAGVSTPLMRAVG